MAVVASASIDTDVQCRDVLLVSFSDIVTQNLNDPAAYVLAGLGDGKLLVYPLPPALIGDKTSANNKEGESGYKKARTEIDLKCSRTSPSGHDHWISRYFVIGTRQLCGPVETARPCYMVLKASSQ